MDEGGRAATPNTFVAHRLDLNMGLPTVNGRAKKGILA